MPQLPMAAATTLDRSLFDVTALASEGQAQVPVVITFDAGIRQESVAGCLEGSLCRLR